MELEIQRMMQNLPVQNKQRTRQENLSAAEQGSETQRPKETAQNFLKKLQSYSKEEVEQYLNKMFKSNLLFNRKLKFSVNRQLNQVIVKVIDRSTDEVIREIPPEEIQRLEAKLKEAIGLLIDEQI
jgi:flagellar protein FlaG